MSDDRGDFAGPALRGFRLQILYTLARLIEPHTALRATLWPEGIEDLAILDDKGVPREVVQIKGYTAPLILSDLVSRSGKGLLQRAVVIARERPECDIRLASFGPFGQELAEAWSGPTAARKRVAHKLQDTGFSQSDVDLLLSRLSLEPVDETVESAKVERFLAAVPALAGQSSHSSAILCQWLFFAAERRERVTQSDLIARLADVGRYLHARAGYWRDWFSVIDPLDQNTDVESQRDRLGDQFQQGINVYYEHILAGCDVPRRRWLDRINAGFQKASVVIVHGASGQGKSALAYRWLQDETPDSWRLEIKLIDTRRDALQIAATLSAHARAVGAPMTIYLDVRPGDSAWTALVQELARLPQIRVLVTIREEDWRRATLCGAAVAFDEIALTLEEPEARDIYRLLDRPDEPAPFLSFDDAWRRFVGSAGNEGPLLEFVYLVTRTETLRERLKQQVDAIRDAATEGQANMAGLRLLALVSFASALGARLDLASIRKEIAEVDLGRIVERLEREYLVRRLDQGLLLDGLHPVRSRLLAEILCDGMTFDAQGLAQHCLGLIAAGDTEVFLLHLATRYPDLMPCMVLHLDGCQLRNWTAAGGILRALLWWGVRQYVDHSAELAAEIRGKHGKAWLVMLDLDLANLLPSGGTAFWKQLDFISEDKKARFQAFLDRQPPKAAALAPARHWLASLTGPPPVPTTQGDWSTIAELSYWAGHWSIDAPVGDWLRAIELDSVLDQLPLQQVSDLLLGRWELECAQMGPWLAEQRERIAGRFRRETDTAWLEDRDGTIRAHFLVSWRDLTNEGSADPDEEADRKDRLHAQAIRRVELLRGLYPDRAGYGCKGYGHQLLPMPYDSTTKRSIKADGLPPACAVRVNGVASALIEWRFRAVEWTDYLSQVWSLREEMAAVMRDLRRALVAHFRNKRKPQPLGNRLDSTAWDPLKQKLSQGIPLPRQAVDEWGFVSEGKDANGQNSAVRIEQSFALAAFRPYLKCQSDLFNGLDNFLEQALPHLYLHCADGKAGIELSRMLIEAKVKEAGGNLVRPELTAHNLAEAVSALPRFQHEFRRLFSSRLPANQLDEQDRRERKLFDTVLSLWNAYLTQPTAHWPEPEQRARALAWQAVEQVPRRIASALRSLEPEGIRAKILKQPDSWEPALPGSDGCTALRAGARSMWVVVLRRWSQRLPPFAAGTEERNVETRIRCLPPPPERAIQGHPSAERVQSMPCFFQGGRHDRQALAEGNPGPGTLDSGPRRSGCPTGEAARGNARGFRVLLQNRFGAVHVRQLLRTRRMADEAG